ncbi:MAG: SDR family NAD(P)-dependent oxidoreductase [Planctomycetota bacterium]
MSRRSIQGKRVIITGASSGIGWHLAIQLAEQGATILATARREDRLCELRETIGDQCITVCGDITDPATRQQIVSTAESQLGGADILINNAGIGAMGRFDAASADRMRQVFEVNFFAVVSMTRAVLPLLKKGEKPIIVNMSSVLAHRAAPLKSEYSASKFALHGFSDSLRAELAKVDREKGEQIVDLLLVSPSTTDSEFFERAIEDDTGKDWKARGAMAPEIVAKKTIQAIKKGQHEIVLTVGGKFLVWLDRLLPGLANRVLARFGQ